MFTGIVEGLGRVSRIQRRGGGAVLEVSAPGIAEELSVGDSVAVNGACVTATSRTGDTFACDLVPETLARTNLGTLQPGEEVNIELPLRASARLDGHIVQGHVDVVGLVRSRRRVGAQEMLEVTIPFDLTPYVAPKGSIAVDGVSLTVVDVSKDRFRVALIPHTVASTTLGRKGQGASVNVEIDVLAKYVHRQLTARGAIRALAYLGGDDAPAPAPRPADPPPGARAAPAAAGRRPAPAPKASRPPAGRKAQPARPGPRRGGGTPRTRSTGR
ncbi:MAG: riboflavin synthase [Acidobacteria bacterium]|nr:riboflavin synthase [Acidobacteriota bacterium]